MSPSPQDTTISLAGLQLVECPKCNGRFKFFRANAPRIDACGFETYSLKCDGCGTVLIGIIDPADDKLLLSEV